ncbi:MAG: 50S ribosomal protein L25 [Phycisphaerales bacterium]
MQATHTLQAERREKKGTRYAKRERNAGKLPCVLYGQGKDPAHLSLNHKEALRFFESGERVFNIELASESKTQTVLLKDLQFDYLGTNVVHCDLIRVNLDDVVEANVHLHMVGDAKGLKTAGAVLVQKMNEVPVRCRVSDLPEEIKIDISDLEANAHLSASDIKLPAGLTLECDPDAVVVIIDVQVETEEGTEGEAISSEGAEPDVIKSKKEEEDK